jgi:hypothetical protein
MYSDWVSPVLLGAGLLAAFLWLCILTFFAFKERGFLNSLFPKSGERDIRKKFEEVLNSISAFEKDLLKTKRDLKNINMEGLDHLQKIELLRFNPYEDTGGDQSFALALLNNKGNGLVLTSLHARSGTRIFAKPIQEGKAENYKLSSEEELVVKKALE